MMDLWRLQMRTARMLAEAQLVIGLRMMGMAGIVPARADETRRMVTEKQTAFADAWRAGAVALATGQGMSRAYGRALTPVGRRTRANAARLTKG
ncbi:MAG: antifreeze protein [Jannaschia sp.]